jgi:hypothetical protein
MYGVIVFMAVATTLVAPPFLTRLFAGEQAEEGADGIASPSREVFEQTDLW